MGCGASQENKAADSEVTTVTDVAHAPPSSEPKPTKAAAHAAAPASVGAAVAAEPAAEAEAEKLPSWTTASGTPVEAVVVNVHSWFFDPPVPVPERQRSTLTAAGPKKPLTILHFNDVYEIGEGKVEPVGGASRFQSMLKQHADSDPLVLFSGDALNPSILSQVTHGQHMVECLNLMSIGVACVGNHDLDLGEANLTEWIQKSNFPWLCSNCWHKESGVPLGNASKEAVVLVHAGRKIGVMGLIEEEWLACCTTVKPETLDYVDLVDAGRALAKVLREEEGCELVIALTHFREPNDERLAVEVPGIDIVLGGHDHHYAKKQCEPTGTYYVKSGADFKWLSKIDIGLAAGGGGGRGDVTVERLEVTRAVGEDPEVKAVVDYYLDNLKAAMGRQLGRLGCPLDARFAAVRTGETNCGNWVADITRLGCSADVGMVNSGALRADVIYPEGSFTVEDMVKLLPFDNLLVVIAITGAQLMEVLENGVSQWPKKEGRFPQVSNLRFSFDGRLPAGGRVVEGSVSVGGEPLDLAKEYSVAVLDLAAHGKEGYDVFLKGKVLRDEEVNADLKTLMRNHLVGLNVVQKLFRSKSSMTDKMAAKVWMARRSSTTAKDGAATSTSATRASWLEKKEGEAGALVAPEVEGRITIIGQEEAMPA